MFRTAPAGRRGLFSYFTFAPAGAGPSFRASEKKQKIAQGTTFLENPPKLRGLFVLRFHCGLSGLKRAAPMDRAKRLFEDVNGRPYRLTR